MLCALAFAAPVRADGVMVYRERPLFRQGPAEPGYCDARGSGSPHECDRVLTKVLSAYSYGRGRLSGGLVLDPASGAPAGVAALRVNAVSAALPGGDAALASVDGALGDGQIRRVRVTLVDAEGLFVCRDAQSRAVLPPMFGMLTRACRPNASLAIDVGMLAVQWDVAHQRVLGEWLRLGPAVELLSNGFGYAHLLRSIEVGLPFDVRSFRDRDATSTETSLGLGLRVSAFYRTPHWEARLTGRERLALLGERGMLSDHSVDGELLLLHNFFVSDAIVMQAGLAVRATWSQEPNQNFAIWADSERHGSAFAGLHLGWAHEAPDI